jgi:ABC-type Zn uptake system ZnuABC Zn-binding protein ZnuA
VRRTKVMRLLGIGLAVAALVAACGSAPAGSGGTSGGKLSVAATTTVFADLVAQVGGDRVDAYSLVPKGGDVHTFDPTPADVRRVSTAALLVRNGLGLDDWLTRLVSDAGTTATVVTLGEDLEGVQYIDGASGEVNPHLWMDVAYAELYVDRIAAALTTADPAGAAAYAANATAYKAKLATLDASIKTRLGAVPEADRVVVSFHDAFPYFAAAYGLTVVGTIVASPGQDPSAGQVADLVAKIKASGAKAIFTEAQFNDALAKAIAAETGAAIVSDLYTDALGDAPQDTYLAMMQWNADRVVAALGGS